MSIFFRRRKCLGDIYWFPLPISWSFLMLVRVFTLGAEVPSKKLFMHTCENLAKEFCPHDSEIRIVDQTQYGFSSDTKGHAM
jgi:hypothetical protein